MDDRNEQGRARELAQARYRFRWHVVVYVLVNLGLVFIWWTSGTGFFWPVFPIFFWGIGVGAHYLRAYHGTENAWVDRETERILREREGHSGAR